MRDNRHLEQEIAELLKDPQYQGHPLCEALETLFQRYQDHLNQIERLTSISDSYHAVVRERSQSLDERFRKQMRQLQKIVRISDHYHDMLRESNDALKQASTHDPLTGLPNRRFMYERLNAEAASVDRRRSPFSIAAVDIDHFKTINDECGHAVGDAALVNVANALSETLRVYDVCARWGGEEFLILLPETRGEAALEIASRLRVTVDNLVHSELPEGMKVSISIGIAEHPRDAPYEETIKRADQALYAAKRAGRNRIVLAD